MGFEVGVVYSGSWFFLFIFSGHLSFMLGVSFHREAPFFLVSVRMHVDFFATFKATWLYTLYTYPHWTPHLGKLYQTSLQSLQGWFAPPSQGTVLSSFRVLFSTSSRSYMIAIAIHISIPAGISSTLIFIVHLPRFVSSSITSSLFNIIMVCSSFVYLLWFVCLQIMLWLWQLFFHSQCMLFYSMSVTDIFL